MVDRRKMKNASKHIIHDAFYLKGRKMGKTGLDLAVTKFAVKFLNFR